jgi:predicted nucleic acid-binding protein
VINLDTNTAIAFVAENSPVRHELKAYIAGQKLVMTQTAFDEFCKIVQFSGGPLERSRATRFLARVAIVPVQLSAAAKRLTATRRLGENDILILGTGDQMGAITMTADAKAIRAAAAQGVDFAVYIHKSYPLVGE